MHSFGHTFAHSSHPMHLYQSIECCPRNAFGSSIRSYGYRTVTGFRLNAATSPCLRVTHSGRAIPRKRPTRPPFPGAAGPGSPDLGDLIGVFAPLHVKDLAFARAHEPTLLRSHPSRLLGLDLLAELQESIDERLRPHRASGDEDVRGYERVRTLHDRVRLEVRPAADRAFPHRNLPLRVRHLLVEPPDRRPELQRNRTVQEEDVTLTRARSVDYAEPLDVIPRVARCRHLDRAAHDAEVQGPGRVPLRPVEEVSDDRVEDPAERPLLERRVDVPVDPLHEVPRFQPYDVCVFSRLNHGVGPAARRPSEAPRLPLRRAEDGCATSAFPSGARTQTPSIRKGEAA